MSTSRSFSQTPRSRQRQNRRWVFFQSPRSGGRSRHGAPVRNIQNTALINSLLSPAGRPTLPFLPGRCACMFSQTLSEISCRRCAYIAPPVMNDMKRCYHIIHSLTTLSRVPECRYAARGWRSIPLHRAAGCLRSAARGRPGRNRAHAPDSSAVFPAGTVEW